MKTSKTSFVKKQVKRITRNLLAVNIALAATVVGTAGLNSRYFSNFFNGPSQIDAQTLNAETPVEDIEKYYVSVEGSESLDTGVEEITTTTRTNKYTGKIVSQKESITGNYITLKVGDRFLLVKATEAEEVDNLEFTGTLEEITEDLKQYVTIDDGFYPYMLNTDNFKIGGYIFLIIGVPTLLICVWNIKRGYDRALDYTKSPVVKTLESYGAIEETEKEIDTQLEEGCHKYNHWDKQLLLTQSWVMYKTFLDINTIRSDRILWVYKTVTQHKTNGIPMRKSYTVTINDASGESLQIPLSRKKAERFLEDIETLAPWVVFGYSEDLKEIWEQDKDQFMEMVEDRKVAVA